MIPKKLHYCWFGTGPKPKSLQSCLESWEQYCPDYEIIEWNEINTPNKNQEFYKNAMRKKRYAFVADCVRTEVMFTYGGIYLDTDMLLLQSLDKYIELDFFIGEEIKGRVNFALFGAVPNHRLLRKMKTFYDTVPFDGFNPPVITHTFKHLFSKILLDDNEVLLEPEYFYPLSYNDRDKNYQEFVSHNTVSVHLWDHSWKQNKIDNNWNYIKNIITVCIDYFFYSYPRTYFIRYFKEYARKLLR